MYSARLVNSLFSYPVGAAASLGDLLPARESTLPGMGGVLTARSPDFNIEDRAAWVFISIKNRSFNRSYVDRFIDMCEATGTKGYVCAVDQPYRYNAMAELGLDALPEKEAAKIERLSSDIRLMVGKAIRGKLSERVELVAWSDLEIRTPTVYREELTRAFEDGTQVRDLLRDHVCSLKPVEDERQFRRFAQFFLCEVPVLMYAYYADGAVIDVYPGPQPSFFWQIELGRFETELPQLTALTRSGRPMLYLDTHHRARRP